MPRDFSKATKKQQDVLDTLVGLGRAATIGEVLGAMNKGKRQGHEIGRGVVRSALAALEAKGLVDGEQRGTGLKAPFYYKPAKK